MNITFNSFPVEIWGTVSDWIMILVTGITGMIIWLTLKEQKKVSSEQQKVTYLQQLQFIVNIQPVFDFPLNKNGTKDYTRIKLIKNFAYNLEIENKSTEYGEELFTPRDLIESVPIDRMIDVFKDNEAHKELHTQININITFKDALQYKYLQKIHGQLSDIVIDPPMMIDDSDKQIKFFPPELALFKEK
ncbi:MAG TPA: hypothetical protein VIM16_22480 [Mucilaginibacter sp.]|jgi:hypothetical protein